MFPSPSQRRSPRQSVALLSLSLVLAACSASGTQPTGASPGASTASVPADRASAYRTPLAGICPDPVVVQTNWYPQADHGFTYELIGPGGKIDANAAIYSGPLGETGVNLEIRAGGPAIGFQQVSSLMYQDPDILLGYIGTDEAIQNSEKAPTVAVFSSYERNPQTLLWGEPSWDFKTIADIGKAGVPVLAFEGSAYLDVFVAKGLLTRDQIDTSYDGTPARFVAAGGQVVQQSIVTAEPYAYEHEVKEWDKPVKYLLLSDDFPVYQNTLSVRADALEKNRACLEALIPIFQQGLVDYVANPTPVNDLLVDYVAQLNGGFVLTPGNAADASRKQVELDLVSNGSNQTIGDFDEARVQGLIDDLKPVFTADGVAVPGDLAPDDLVTNDFIDPSIGLSDR